MTDPHCHICGTRVDPTLPTHHPRALTRTPVTRATSDQPELRPAHRHCARPDPVVLYPATRAW